MSDNRNLTVNVLPVTTYNFLHVNDSTLEITDLNIKNETPAAKEALPAGVSLKEKASPDEVNALFSPFRDRIHVISDVHRDPNGDTSGREESRIIRSGMGSDIDDFLEGIGASTDIYTVAEGTKAAAPIVLSRTLSDKESVAGSYAIYAGRDAEVTVILFDESEKDAAGFLGTSVRLLADEGATIRLIKAQTLGSGFVHFYDVGGAALKGGNIELVTLELGGRDVYSSAYITLSEKSATLSSEMGYLCRDDHSLDANYVADHRGKKSEAHMNFRGVLMGTAKKTLRGTLDFKTGSSGSVGDEQEDALLLDPDVINRTMPIILCQEEDVEGRHGATIGQLSEDLLFYMQTRGIDEDEAKRIMIRARLESVSRLIVDDEIRHKVKYYIQNII